MCLRVKFSFHLLDIDGLTVQGSRTHILLRLLQLGGL
jgi:hypothetical protein